MTRSYLGYVSSQTTDFIPLMTYGVATGGTSSSITVDGQAYTLLTFTGDGTLTVTKAGLFDVLLFAGGGGVATTQAEIGGGGGGGGGYVLTTAYLSTNQSIVIGAGGSNSGMKRGTDTYLTQARILANGGAPGTIRFYSVDTDPKYGNGGGYNGNNLGVKLLANALGFDGGDGSTSRNDLTWNGGGGGGGGGAGVAGAFNSGGNGGAGYDVSSFIGGSTLSKGGGGGGGAKNAGTGGAGGANGASTSGGAGGANGAGSSAGANSAGGGGGGCAQSSAQAGGSGGSGIAYIRFKV